MRFNVLGFDQLKATELGLNLDELMLLRHLQDFTNSGKMDTVIHNGKMYYWVKYDKFVDDLPILNMKKTRVMEIFNNNLCVKPKDWEDRYNSMSESSKKRAKSFKFIGVLESYTKKDAEGTKSYFTFTKLFYSLMPNITNNDVDMGNKKAPTFAEVEAQNPKKQIDNNIIPQNNKKYSPKNKENKNNTGKGASANVNNTFTNYSEDELEKMLLEKQAIKFKPNYPINN